MDKDHKGSSAFNKWKIHILQWCTDPLWRDPYSKEAQLFSWGGKGPNYNNASITGQPTCSYDTIREKWPSTSSFFFPQDNCWDLILMLFCVVLYFHAKILLYLNVFILLNVLFFWLYPRIAVIILMSQYLTSFCERDQRKERKTLNFSSSVDLFTFAIQKNECWKVLSQDLYSFLCFFYQYHKCCDVSVCFT